MDYNVWTRGERWNINRNCLVWVNDWSVSDGGLRLAGALTAMLSRAIQHNIIDGERIMEQYLSGKLDVTNPFRVSDEAVGDYLWFCVLPYGSRPKTETEAG